MKIELGFGKTTQAVEIPDKNVQAVLEANEISVEVRGEPVVVEALKHPVGTKRLEEIVKPGEKIAIITSDITRPVPSYLVIPPILDTLLAAGCKPEDITVVFALGVHRGHTQEEMKKLVGEKVYDMVKCMDGNPDDFIHLGKTDGGTPVDVTRVVAEADRRICVANVEYHYFAGYSGGAKSIMPGVSTRAAIQNNHSRMIQPEACAGNIDTNPVRLDLEEAIAKFCPIDFIVNVVLDEHKKIIHAQCGDYIQAHRLACKYLDGIYRVYIDKRAEIVIASQAGAPKDLNLYQVQKALDNAKHAVANGGVIILVGACNEGLGEDVFEEWMLSAKKPQDLIDRIKVNFQLGGHKAAAIAMVMENADIYLVSEMEPDFVRSLFMTPFATVQEAYDAAVKKLGADAGVIVMPYGGSTLPTSRT